MIYRCQTMKMSCHRHHDSHMIVYPSQVADLIWNSVRLNRFPCNHRDLSIWFSLQNNINRMPLVLDMVYVRKQHRYVIYQHLKKSNRNKTKKCRQQKNTRTFEIATFVSVSILFGAVCNGISISDWILVRLKAKVYQYYWFRFEFYCGSFVVGFSFRIRSVHTLRSISFDISWLAFYAMTIWSIVCTQNQ